MAEPPSAAEIARELADVFERQSIPYAIGGAIAYGLHAPPRATNDVDVNVFVEPDGLATVLDALESVGAELDREGALASSRERGDFQAWMRGMRVDVFTTSIPLSIEARDRVVDAKLGGRPVKVLSAEDLTLFKLLFFRGKDVVDIERLVPFRGPELDRAYIRRWLVEMVGEEDGRVREWDRIVLSSP